ncbi:MAG: N-acetylmuramoyl-L-alanine amidase [Bacillota bacterium]
MSQQLVILNPGHHLPKDPGATGNGIKEADITVKICNLIKEKSQLYGFDVVIVHEHKLSEICKIANQYKNAFLFLSIHINSATNPTATGFESFVFPGSAKSDKLRNTIHAKLGSFMNHHGFVDRGKKSANFYVLRNTVMPAILTENLFVSNPRDAEILKDAKFLSDLADIYCQGIAEALGILLNKESDNMEKVTIVINDKKIEGYLIGDKAYAPVRILINSLNKTVTWEENKKTVIIK